MLRGPSAPLGHELTLSPSAFVLPDGDAGQSGGAEEEYAGELLADAVEHHFSLSLLSLSPVTGKARRPRQYLEKFGLVSPQGDAQVGLPLQEFLGILAIIYFDTLEFRLVIDTDERCHDDVVWMNYLRRETVRARPDNTYM